MPPLISVVIPVWNSEATLQACLESVLTQDACRLEVIVVDDGSTDGSWKLLQSLAAQDERILPLHQENAGVSAARNHALAHAQGEYIRFVDSDDLLPPGSLQLMLRCAQENESDLVLGAYTEIMLNQETHRDLGQCEETVSNAELLRRLEPWANSFYYGVLWNKLFRGDVIRSHQLRFDPGLVWGEDFCFVMAYMAHAERITYTRASIYQYIRNPKGAVMRQIVRCVRQPIQSVQDRLTIYRSYQELYRRRGAYRQYRHRLWLYLFRFTLRN